MRYLLTLSLFLAALYASSFANADDKTSWPNGKCKSLLAVSAPNTKTTQSAMVTNRTDLPKFCQVEGRIADRVGFVMRLPDEGWNGKFVVTGCGGFCGSLNPDKPGHSNGMNEALKRHYAVIQTDGGHQAKSWDTDWAIGDKRALELYGGAWMPLAVATGKAIVAAYYTDVLRRTYFSGCSNGGRLGMFAAQRYPTLFDGIAAGGAIFDLTGNAGVHGLWKLQTTKDKQGRKVYGRNGWWGRMPGALKPLRDTCV